MSHTGVEYVSVAQTPPPVTIPTVDRLLTSPEVVALAGLTYRQLDHAVRRGVLRMARPVAGSGDRRLFHAREAQIAWVMAQVQEEAGARDITRLAHAVDMLRDAPRWGGYLVVSGGVASIVEDETELGELAGPIAVLRLDACPVSVDEEAVA